LKKFFEKFQNFDFFKISKFSKNFKNVFSKIFKKFETRCPDVQLDAQTNEMPSGQTRCPDKQDAQMPRR